MLKNQWLQVVDVGGIVLIFQKFLEYKSIGQKVDTVI